MKCRGCGAEIVWIRMQISGKQMPVDAKPVSVAYEAGAETFIREDGVPIRGKRVTDAEARETDGPVMEAYVSHFATCPAAGKFRKGGGRHVQR